MDKLEQLTMQFNKRHPRFIDVTTGAKPRDAHTLFLDTMGLYSQWAVNTGLIKHRSDLKKLDMIDVKDIFTQRFGSADLPALKFSNKNALRSKLNECWYYILPPFKEGVIRINRHRYIKYGILEINEEDQEYTVSLEDYGYDQHIWVQNNLCVGICQYQLAEDGLPIKYRTAGDTLSHLVAGDLEEDPKTHPGLSDEDRLYLTKVAIPYLKSIEYGESTEMDDLFMHFVGVILETNYQLSLGKPKAKRGSGNKIQTKAGEIDRNPKPKIVRALSGGILVTSVKPPRPASPDTIRTYHIAAWKSRGHIRHYKDGRTTYVRESIHHRKCLQTDEKVAIPQTIIKVG